ncbi:MAG: SusC/RagA family TonB-linked outer membrane protein, partial [Candidatus Symbiothrix sp.]|nr:SusC/RagA family TonB-linked outer membrane protein [Candidatus Symbiothrix sp.]
MRNKLFLFLLLLMLSFFRLQAQESTFKLTGMVSDEKKEPVIGANITISGSKMGTSTGLDGKFTMQVKADDVLIISYLGYETQNVHVGKRTHLNIILKEDVKQLDEVVITAMGISRDAKSLPYARQAVDTKSMTESRDASLLNMLAGKVSGLQMISAGGPLSSTRVVIRGNNSLTENNQPMYVVDGVPIRNDMGTSGDLDYGNAANNINPDDIESMEVLKGANASALYGSDAANGVILITTKKGSKKAGLGISYALNSTFSYLYQYPTMQNVYGAGAENRWLGGYNTYNTSYYNPELPYGMFSMIIRNDGTQAWGMPMLGFDVVGRNGEVKSYSPSPETIGNMYKTGVSVTNSVSADKVFDNGSSMRFSYTNIHADDILENFNILDRHSFNIRSFTNLAKFMSLDVGLKYVYEDVSNRGYRNSSSRNPLWIFANLPRDATLAELMPWKNPDGTPVQRNGIPNPYWALNESSNADDSHWLLGNVSLNFQLHKLLKLRLTGATDISSRRNWRFDNYYSPYDNDGAYEESSGTTVNNNFDALLMYDHNLTEKIRIGANIGASDRYERGYGLWTKAEALLQSDVKSLSNSLGETKSSQSYWGKEKQALYGAFNFAFDNWLYLDATARNEWSSALPKSNWSYFYYSYGTGIILTDLLKLNSPVLSFAKIRASYAQVGNDTGFDRLINGYNRSNETFLGYTYYRSEEVRKNATLKPERTDSKEIGADIRFFKGRISLDATYYHKTTSNQIIEAGISKISGYDRKIFNAGEIQNQGVELSMEIVPIETRNFRWQTNFNWAMNRSKVLSLAPGVDRFRMDDAEPGVLLYIEVGKPYGVIYGDDYQRDPEGRIYVNLNGVPLSTPDQYLGCVEPDFLGGWRNSFSYKDFDLNFMIDFKKGGVLYSSSAWRGGVDGQTVQSLAGREEDFFSKMILGENDDERRGFLSSGNTIRPGADFGANSVLYPDGDRTKGVYMENTVYGPDVEYWAGQPSMAWVRPMEHWRHNYSSRARYIYDASYIKFRELSFGYNIPKKWLAKAYLSSARISAVGRNIAILYQKTPKGIDPEATSSVGNAQGLEKGFAL